MVSVAGEGAELVGVDVRVVRVAGAVQVDHRLGERARLLLLRSILDE